VAPDASIDLLDVTGRRVVERSVQATAPGRYTVEMPETCRLPAGLYFACLTQRGLAREKRVVIVR